MVEGGEPLGREFESCPLGDILPVGLTVQCAGIVVMAVCPVVLLEDLIRHTGGGNERRVRIDIGQLTEDLAEIEDDGARDRVGGGLRIIGRVRGGHVSIMKRAGKGCTT